MIILNSFDYASCLSVNLVHRNEHKFVFGPHVDALLKVYRKTVLGDIRARQTVVEHIVEGEISKLSEMLFTETTSSIVVDLR